MLFYSLFFLDLGKKKKNPSSFPFLTMTSIMIDVKRTMRGKKGRISFF